MPRHLFPEWRTQNQGTQYPFAETVSLRNTAGAFLPAGTFLDAAIYPVGGREGAYLARVEIDYENVTLTIGDAGDAARATATFPGAPTSGLVVFTDAVGRPAGVLVSEPQRLSVFQAWGAGTHTFTADQTEFAATVCFPTPDVGVSSIVLEDGSTFSGDVWLVGGDGVVVRPAEVTVPAIRGEEITQLSGIRIDVVGDPLFRQRLCQPQTLFETPQFVRTIRFKDGEHTFDVTPDEFGNIQLFGGDALSVNTLLRINPTITGLSVKVVGSPVQSK